MYDAKDLEIAKLKGQIELLKEQLAAKQVIGHGYIPFIQPIPSPITVPYIEPIQPWYQPPMYEYQITCTTSPASTAERVS